MSTPPTPPDPPERFDGLDPEDPTGMRALLASLPDPGPMPPDLVQRITASLASERLAREREHTVVPLRPRQHRWRRAGLVAAAAAVVAVGVPALLTGSSPGDLAALLTRQNGAESASTAKGAAASDSSGGSGYTQPTGTATSSPSDRSAAAAAGTTIYASTTAYTTASLTSQLRELVGYPGTPMAPKAADSPALAAVATPTGLRDCLRAIGVTPHEPVIADLATYNGAPVVALVVGTGTARQGYVLRRDCATTPSTPLAGPISLG